MRNPVATKRRAWAPQLSHRAGLIMVAVALALAVIGGVYGVSQVFDQGAPSAAATLQQEAPALGAPEVATTGFQPVMAEDEVGATVVSDAVVPTVAASPPSPSLSTLNVEWKKRADPPAGWTVWRAPRVPGISLGDSGTREDQELLQSLLPGRIDALTLTTETGGWTSVRIPEAAEGATATLLDAHKVQENGSILLGGTSIDRSVPFTSQAFKTHLMLYSGEGWRQVNLPEVWREGGDLFYGLAISPIGDGFAVKAGNQKTWWETSVVAE